MYVLMVSIHLPIAFIEGVGVIGKEGIMEKGKDMTKLLLDAPRDCWLALNENETEVVARGESVRDAVEEARKKGIEDPIIMWSPKKWLPTVY